MRVRIVAAIAAISAMIGSLLGVGAAAVLDSGGDNGVTAAPTSANQQSTADKTQGQTALVGDCLTAADVYEQVRPAVVEITSTQGAGGPSGQQGSGTGTGIILDSDGHILTNHHVVDGASSMEVRFEDGSTASARLTGSDPANDVAVIQVDATGLDLAVAKLGDSDALRVGDAVLAVGSPFHLEGTLTQGIVSAVDRTYGTGASTRPIRGMIQTDAAVNPGNSGGPLLNCRGEVVGINTLLENPTGDNVNVGVAFAVAINTAKGSLSGMMAGETASHPWLGIAGVDLTPAVADEARLDTSSGVYVTVVSAGSPADSAGLRAAFASQAAAANSDTLRPGGDVIIAADGRQMMGIEELATYLDENKHPGDSVELTILRDGEQITLQARLAEWPS